MQKVRRLPMSRAFCSRVARPRQSPDATGSCVLASFGFALIAVMQKINLELAMWGVELAVQVGIHSGKRLAGVIVTRQSSGTFAAMP